ncbi:uncharacterized protein [Euwallacea fornicatus]|uniref:uncharacterized protein isoform X2 n=1 Tax=Euwallacea fornicatus TaxID=995702 RepID=UPI00338E0E20
MQFLHAALFIWILCLSQLIQGLPLDTSLTRNESNAKSAFGQPFDEVIVESTLNVKRKASPSRQSRSDQLKRTKRQSHNHLHRSRNPILFRGSSAATALAQAQSHEAKNPLGAFGSSGSQSQSFSFGPNGPLFSAGFAGAQQYKLPNGQVLNVSFGNSIGGTGTSNAGGVSVSFTERKS